MQRCVPNRANSVHGAKAGSGECSLCTLIPKRQGSRLRAMQRRFRWRYSSSTSDIRRHSTVEGYVSPQTRPGGTENVNAKRGNPLKNTFARWLAGANNRLGGRCMSLAWLRLPVLFIVVKVGFGSLRKWGVATNA